MKIYLKREDLTSDNKKIKNATVYDFGLPKEIIEKASDIVFTEEDGTKTILKERYTVPKYKNYLRIDTIEDIFKIVDNDNIENFLMDFNLYALQTVKLINSDTVDSKDVNVASMYWQDDGVNEISGMYLNDKFIELKKK